MVKTLKCTWCERMYASEKTLKQHLLACQKKQKQQLDAAVENAKHVQDLANDDIELALNTQITQLKALLHEAETQNERLVKKLQRIQQAMLDE